MAISRIRFVSLLVGVFSMCQESASLKSVVIKVPSAVKSGDSVTLKCEYDLENVPLYSIKWYWNDEEFYRYIPKESPPYKAFPVKLITVDLSKSGENAVTLRNVHRGLTGMYKCEVSADGPLFHTDILCAKMIIAELPPGDPEMHIKEAKVEIGRDVNAECYIGGSDPAANITWFINNEEARDNSDFITIFPTQIDTDAATELKSSRSKISILTNKSHFIQSVMTLRCDVTILNLWKGVAESAVKDESPKLVQVLGSTLSQSQLDPVFETGNVAWMRTTDPRMMLASLIFPLMLWR